EPSIQGASWIVCTTAGGVKRDVISTLRAASEARAPVTLGAHGPRRGGAMREIAQAYRVEGLEVEPLDEPGRADALVARRIDELALPAPTRDAPGVHRAVHEDEAGVPRVAFVMNPTTKPVLANV